MSHFNEHALEMAIMELFEKEGYIYTSGEVVHKELSDVLLRDDLRAYLRDRYAEQGITSLEVESVIARLTANMGGSLYENNVHTYCLITEGFSIKREDASKADLFIEPIDFCTEANNIIRIVNQLEIKGLERRIPDGIIYINGLPMVVLEFKSAVKEETTIKDAFTQLTVRYRRDIPELFKYNAFVVISDGVNSKYGSLFTPYEFFYAWRKVEATDKATDGVSSLLTMVQGLFRKDRLLSVIKDFVFLPDSSKREQKIVCRYPQFFATHKLFNNIRQHSKLNADGDGKGGTYFGATGCGKSFTMLFLTRMLMRSREFASPTILLITDRTDLDTQLSEQFGTAKKFIGDECVVEVESRAKLREYLEGRTSGGVFLTTIHKFTEDIQLLSKRANIICISDEAHRSQTNLSLQVRQTESGVKRSYGFAKYLHDSLPNATYVGFTGTPIDATIDVFGEVVDVNIVYKYLNELKAYHLWSADIEEKVFEVYTATQEMGKLTSLFKPVMEDYNSLDEEDKFKVRSLVRNFNRFYSYMAQIVRTFDVELYKTYIFTELLYKLLPKTPHEKVDLTGKLALEHNKLSEAFSGSIVMETTAEYKTLKSETGGSGSRVEEKKDLLSNIIEKINLMYHGNFTEADRVIVETIYDAMKKEEKKLSKQAKNSDVNMFAQNIFPKVFEKIAQDCYVQQMDAFAKLFEEPSFYGKVMEEMGRAMYFNFKNGEE